jgi:S-formylglutathione hydrolase FrmB
MAFLDVHAFSDALGTQVNFYVLLPQQTRKQIGAAGGANYGPFRTLWLLHGLSDDHSIWMRRTSIERYAAALNLAVVMPPAGRSFYQDMANGARHWTFLTRELPALCRAWFPLSAKRDDNFVAGLSMGGYGALRMALTFPERYSAGASLSGALDMGLRLKDADKEGGRMTKEELVGIFGEKLEFEGTERDLFTLATRVANAGPRPRLFACCGTEDTLLDDNRAFHGHLDSLSFAHTYEESVGAHEWEYWDAQIQRVLNWLPT